MTVQGCALLAEQPVPSLLKTKQEGSAYENPADSCDTGAWYLWAPGGRGDANIISVNYLLHAPDIW